MFSFGEIRAFTGAEVAKMQAELRRIDGLIYQREAIVSSLTINPVNYVLGTQRDAMTRLRNALDQSKRIRAQLADTMSATIESGDTSKLAKWLGLAKMIGDASDTRVWNEQAQYSSTAETVKNVGKDTYEDVKNKLNIGAMIAVAVGALYVLINFGPRRK